MKRSLSIPKLCDAAYGEFKYEINNGMVYLSDKVGSFGLWTMNTSLIDDLKKRGCELSQADGLKKIFESMDRNGKAIEIHDSGVTLTGRGDCRDKRVALYHNGEGVYAFNRRLFEVFKPDMVLKEKSYASPAILLCEECTAIIMPIRPNSEFRKQCKIVDDFSRLAR